MIPYLTLAWVWNRSTQAEGCQAKNIRNRDPPPHFSLPRRSPPSSPTTLAVIPRRNPSNVGRWTGSRRFYSVCYGSPGVRRRAPRSLSEETGLWGGIRYFESCWCGITLGEPARRLDAEARVRGLVMVGAWGCPKLTSISWLVKQLCCYRSSSMNFKRAYSTWPAHKTTS